MQLPHLLPVLTLCLFSLHAGAIVTVKFDNPGQYRDASLEGTYQVDAGEPALREIGSHLRKLGERYLSPEETLSVEVLDVDLAGRFEPWRMQFHRVRIMDSLTWPMIRLRYTFHGGDRTGLSAEERVVDQTYLGRQRTYFSGDRLGYEKQMLDDWFRARFVEHRPPR